MNDASQRPSRSPVRWAVAGAIALVAATSTLTHADPDLWGHVRFGIDIIQTKEIADVDPYSFTQDRPWINHEWLSELQMGLAYRVAGPAGLSILKGALVVIALWLVWSGLAGVSLVPRMLIAASAVIGTAQILGTLRPQLWSFVCLAILGRVLISGSSRARWWLPVLFAVWANLHGGWIVGLVVLAVYDLMPGRLTAQRAVVVAVSLGAALVTPYGWRLWEFLFGTVRMTRPNIEDWLPLWKLSPEKWIPWAGALIATLWAARHRFQARLSTVAVLLILAYASLRVGRIVPLFVLSAAILLVPLFVLRWPRGSRAVELVPTRHDALAAVVICAVAVATSTFILRYSLACVSSGGERMPDAVAASALSRAGGGNLITFFNWGQYAIWHLGPRLRVSMDGRRETVYSDRRLAEHDAILFGTPEGLATLAEWRPEYVWLPDSSGNTRRWLETNGYRIELLTGRSFVAVRNDLPPLRGSVESAGHHRRCFPE